MTLFIILGLVILIALALLIVVKKELVTFKPEEIIPTEKGKVSSFITSCMERIGEEALFTIGVQGGYLDVPSDIANDGNTNLRLSPFTVIPYWAYGPHVRIPSLPEIKQRLDNDMRQNLKSCLFDTKAFTETYDLTEKSDLTPDTKILDGKVLFNVHWDVEIRDKAGEVVTEIINHQAESKIKLKRLYDTARRIMEKELSDLKLEDLTQDLLALEHPDVPVTGIEFDCFKKEWDVLKAKKTIQDLIHVNIGQLQVKGTEVVEFPDTLPYYQNHYSWDLGEFTAPDVSVAFNYDQNYPFTFSVTPLSGGKLRSTLLGGSQYVPLVCVQNWKFTYDIAYPVLVRLRDETTGYNFNVAFTVHLYRNTPNRNAAPSSRSSTVLETVTNEDYCRNANLPMTFKTFELVENKAEGIFNREPLENVNLSFTCLRYRCDLSPTRYNYANLGDVAAITQNVPYCVGGILRGTKGNYREDWQRVVTAPGKEAELNLAPLRTIPASKIRVVKHKFESPEKIGTGFQLGPNELALVKITTTKKDPVTNLPFLESNLVVSPKLDDELQQLQLLAKADFTYQLEISLVEEEDFLGGYKGNWTVSWNKLQQAKEITFHIASREDASEEERFTFLLNLEEPSRYLPTPEIK